MKWKRVIGWTLLTLTILIVVAGVAGYFVLKSEGFHRYVLAKVVQNIEEATGGQAEVRSFDFRFSTLTATLYGITLHGTEPRAQRPLLQVDKLTVGLKIQSVLHRRVNLSDLRVEHPVVNILVDNQGKINIPQPRSKATPNGTSVFDLAVRHALLNDGEVFYNDRKQPLNADLYDLRAEIHFDPLATRYRGELAYDNGHLRYGTYTPLAHQLNVKFAATPQELSIDSFGLEVGSSRLSLRANITNYASPKVEGAYQLQLDMRDLSSMSPGVKPSGEVVSSGGLSYNAADGQTLLRAVSARGEIQSQGLAVAASQGHLAVSKLHGTYQLSNGTLQAHNVTIDLLGGRVTADINIQHLDSTSPIAQVRTVVRGLSLVDARRSLRNPEVSRLPLTGTLEGKADASWTGSVRNIRVLSDISLGAALWDAARNSAVPIDGSFHLNYDGLHNSLNLRQSFLKTRTASVTLQGEISDHSNLQVNTQAADLHELAVLLSALRGSAAKPLVISGAATLRAVVQGSVGNPRISGQLNADNLHVQGSQWRNVQLAFQASPSQIAIQNGSLEHMQRGSATFSAQVGLQNWSYQPTNPIAANLSVHQLAIGELERLANLEYPLTGNLSADISLRGSQLSPAAHGTARLTKATVFEEPFQNLSLQMEAAGGTVHSVVHANLPAGTANANLTYTPKTRAYEIRFDAPAILLQKLQAVQSRNLPISGTLAASASGSGTLDDPRLNATLQFPQLQLRNTAVTGFKAQVAVADHRATLTLNSQLAQASVQAQGVINLTPGYYAEFKIDTTKFPLDPLLAAYVSGLPPDFQGSTELHASLKGPLGDRTKLEAHIAIPTLNASYQAIQLSNAQPIRVDYANSVVTIQPTHIQGTDTDLRLEGSVPLAGNAPLSLVAQGSIDASLMRIFSPDVKSSGNITLDVRGSGSVHNPAIQGQVRIQDVYLSTPAAPVAVEKLNAALQLTNDQLQISNLTGQVGGGDISAGGAVVYRPNVQFNIALRGRSMRLLYPQGVRSVLNSDLVLSGTPQAAVLSGRVLLDSLTFTPDFDLASFTGQFNSSAAPSSGEGLADHVKLAVTVQSKDNLSAQSTQLSIEGQVNLQAIGTVANPVIVGRTDLTAGELFFLNNRYEIERGIISFNNATQTEPVLNVMATTTIQQYNLTVTLSGPIEKLTATYTSDPPLPTADVINLMARGQTTQQSDASGQGADSILAGQAASQVTGGIQKLAGISSLTIDPLIGGNNTNPSARVALQQRLTKNFLFTFSTDVSQPESEILQGDYQINKRWSVSVVRNQVGGVSVDGKFHTKF